MPWSGSSHFLRRGLDGLDDFVISGAAAEIAGKTETDFLFGGVGVLGEQGARRDQEPRRADATLERCKFEEVALQGVEFVAIRHALYRLYLAAFGLGTEHQT